MTAHDALVDYALQLLQLPVPVCDGPIGEDIDAEMLAEGEQSAVQLELVGSDPTDQQLNTNPVDWSTVLQVTCAAREDHRTATGRASRALHSLVHTRLNADASWGSRLMYLSPPQLRFGASQLNTRLGMTVATYTLQHRTPANTLEA